MTMKEIRAMGKRMGTPAPNMNVKYTMFMMFEYLKWRKPSGPT